MLLFKQAAACAATHGKPMTSLVPDNQLKQVPLQPFLRSVVVEIKVKFFRFMQIFPRSPSAVTHTHPLTRATLVHSLGDAAGG